MVVRRLPHPQLVPGTVADGDLGLRFREAIMHARDVLGFGDSTMGSPYHVHVNPVTAKRYIRTDISANDGPYRIQRVLWKAHASACDLLLYLSAPNVGPLNPGTWRVHAIPLFGLTDFPDGAYSVPARPDARDPYNHRLELPTAGLYVLDVYLDRYSVTDAVHIVPVNACGTESPTHANGITPSTGDLPPTAVFPTTSGDGVYNAAWLRLARKVKEVQCRIYDPDAEGVGRHTHGAGVLANPTVLFLSSHGIPADAADSAVLDTAETADSTSTDNVIGAELLEGLYPAGAVYQWFALVWADAGKSSVMNLVVEGASNTTSAATELSDLGVDWHLLTGTFTATGYPTADTFSVTQAATGGSQKVGLVSFLIVREVL